ncbi:MAG TPA: S1-like domain-containing RNA-binding protein [Bacteroidales bacterium]|jgi:predicted RNA-binding protein (virulence factor B family)|nr:S1-like domain-containing RNA-binding protein [Bacteroidales bacterium]HXK82267.1 S1-like domain-containing RNA-binding protein [Bacteroidales bacterium]
MIYPGQIFELKASRQTDNGIYLVDEDNIEVLLPNKYIPDDLELGGNISVFVYKDSEDRLIATTLQPKIFLNCFAPLKAVDKNKHGVFFDMGLEKDLFVPHNQQQSEIKLGHTYVVYMYLDNVTNRLVGSTKISKWLERDIVEVEIGEEVQIMVYGQNDIGYNVIVNMKYRGIIFENEVFIKISIGDNLKAYVKKIRSDNKLDLSLNRFGYRGVDANTQKLIETLEENEGFLALIDNTAPEKIYEILGMSKKVFKKAVGALYKQKIIRLENDGIRLIKNQ